MNNLEKEAYQQGWKCGRSPAGLSDENPHRHRLSKLRMAWLKGWMDGGAIYIDGAFSNLTDARKAAARGVEDAHYQKTGEHKTCGELLRKDLRMEERPTGDTFVEPREGEL